MKYSELSLEDQKLAREIQKTHPWLRKNQCASIVVNVEREADPVCVCFQTDKNAGHILFGVKHAVDPETYAAEKKKTIAALDEVSAKLDKLGLQNPNSDIHTKRIAIFLSNFINWQKEAIKTVEKRGSAENVAYIVNGNYWNAPQNAFRLIAELYAPVVDRDENFAKEIIREKSVLTLSFHKRSSHILPDFYAFT